jgi:hypothetical protein
MGIQGGRSRKVRGIEGTDADNRCNTEGPSISPFPGIGKAKRLNDVWCEIKLHGFIIVGKYAGRSSTIKSCHPSLLRASRRQKSRPNLPKMIGFNSYAKREKYSTLRAVWAVNAESQAGISLPGFHAQAAVRQSTNGCCVGNVATTLLYRFKSQLDLNPPCPF